MDNELAKELLEQLRELNNNLYRLTALYYDAHSPHEDMRWLKTSEIEKNKKEGY